MNYSAASYGISKDNVFCHSVLGTESRKTGFPLPDRVEDKLRGNDSFVGWVEPILMMLGFVS